MIAIESLLLLIQNYAPQIHASLLDLSRAKADEHISKVIRWTVAHDWLTFNNGTDNLRVPTIAYAYRQG